jgi:L-fuculose-phosphate aldolase
MYAREFVAAHEGNLSIRLPDGNFLCTPTMHCKGFLSPKDLCVIDAEMNQISGTKKPTSEIRLHLSVYRLRPDVNAVVHSHAPHATAFAVANKPFPCGVLAEPELFLGEVALAPFKVPGTDDFAKSITPLRRSQTRSAVGERLGRRSAGRQSCWQTMAWSRTPMTSKKLFG